MSDEEIVNGEVVEPDSGTDIAMPEDVLPEQLHIMPINSRPYFPGQAQPVVVNMDQWQATLASMAQQGQQVLGLSYVPEENLSDLQTDNFPAIGCVVRLHRLPDQTDGPGQFIVQGLRRFRITRWLNPAQPYLAQVEYPASEGNRESDEVRAYAMAIIRDIKELLPLNPLYSEELKQYLGQFNPNKPSLLADFSAALTSARGRITGNSGNVAAVGAHGKGAVAAAQRTGCGGIADAD